VFLGDLTAPLQTVGNVYVGLLQMTVLPYIVVSLISRIGSFSYERAKAVAAHGSVVQMGLWALALAVVVVLPQSLPEWRAGAFFSSSLVEEAERFDLLGLYLPTNPFGSLANNVVPAAVVFSILLGIATIPLADKSRLLGPLDVIGDALGNIARVVINLSPWGTFALAAGIAGTAGPAELARITGYMSAITIGIVLLGLLIFPALVAVLTPIPYGALLRRSRGTLLTVFATGKLFAVLPMVIEDVRSLLAGSGIEAREAREAADVLVPLAYPFPNGGRILAIMFIPFAGWFTGQPLGAEDYPLLLSAGFLSFFGNPVAAIPFLLGLFRLPVDLLALFLVAGIWAARVADVLGAMHLTAFALLTTYSEKGLLRLRAGRAIGLAGASALGLVAAMWLNNALVSWSIQGEPSPANRVASMQPYFEGATLGGDATAGADSASVPGETALERIRRTGELRIGYVPGSPPFSYRNGDGGLVGLDIDLAHRLAIELGATLRPVPFAPDSLDAAFATDRFDIAVGGLGSHVQEPGAYRESVSYLSLHAAVVVPDYRVGDFRTMRAVRAMEGLRLGYVAGGILINAGRYQVPGLEVVVLPTAEQYLEGNAPDVDALLTTAETGAIYSMIYPGFSVIVPDGFRVRVPLVFAVAADDALVRTVDRFLQIKQQDGTVDILFDHWIRGGPSTAPGRRWSVVRDVLGWGVD